MSKGHLDQTRKNRASTKANVTDTKGVTAEIMNTTMPDPATLPTSHTVPKHDAIPDPDTEPDTERYPDCAPATKVIYTQTWQITEKGCGDATGKFPAISSSGNQYVMLFYAEDPNFILPVPMKDRNTQSYIAAYSIANKYFTSKGFKFVFWLLDNEISNDLKDYITGPEMKAKYQLVPSGCHRRNPAERAIRTFKNQFIAILCGIDKDFPWEEQWDTLLPHATVKLNLMRGSRVVPNTSAWAQLHVPFDSQQNTSSNSRDTSSNPRETRQARDMGTTRPRRLVCRSSTRALQVLSGTSETDKEPTYNGHSRMAPRRGHHAGI